MPRKTLLATGMVTAIGLGISTLALAHGPGGTSGTPNAGGHYGWHMGPMMGQGMGPGMMGQGQMGQGMMGSGMMGQGQMGPGMMGPGMMGQGQMGQGMMQPLRQDLSAADVKHMIGHRLAWNGNPNVKLGKVEEKDDDTIIAEIVTKDGSIIQKLEIDRHTGRMRSAQ